MCDSINQDLSLDCQFPEISLFVTGNHVTTTTTTTITTSLVCCEDYTSLLGQRFMEGSFFEPVASRQCFFLWNVYCSSEIWKVTPVTLSYRSMIHCHLSFLPAAWTATISCYTSNTQLSVWTRTLLGSHFCWQSIVWNRCSSCFSVASRGVD